MKDTFEFFMAQIRGLELPILLNAINLCLARLSLTSGWLENIKSVPMQPGGEMSYFSICSTLPTNKFEV